MHRYLQILKTYYYNMILLLCSKQEFSPTVPYSCKWHHVQSIFEPNTNRMGGNNAYCGVPVSTALCLCLMKLLRVVFAVETKASVTLRTGILAVIIIHLGPVSHFLHNGYLCDIQNMLSAIMFSTVTSSPLVSILSHTQPIQTL